MLVKNHLPNSIPYIPGALMGVPGYLGLRYLQFLDITDAEQVLQLGECLYLMSISYSSESKLHLHWVCNSMFLSTFTPLSYPLFGEYFYVIQVS